MKGLDTMLKKKGLITLIMCIAFSATSMSVCYAENPTANTANILPETEQWEKPPLPTKEEQLEQREKSKEEKIASLYAELETMSEDDVMIIQIDADLKALESTGFFKANEKDESITVTADGFETIFFGFQNMKTKMWIGCVTKPMVYELIKFELATDKDLLYQEDGEIIIQKNDSIFAVATDDLVAPAIPDYNNDSVTDLTDLTALSLYIIGDVNWNDEQVKNFDCNADGNTDLADLAHLKQYIMGEDVKLG